VAGRCGRRQLAGEAPNALEVRCRHMAAEGDSQRKHFQRPQVNARTKEQLNTRAPALPATRVARGSAVNSV